MVEIARTALTGLQVAQQGLATTGHNIANASTPGYSRQTVDQVARAPQYTGPGGFVGTGVEVATISRTYDKFLTQQVRSHTATQQQLSTQSDLVGQINSLLTDSSAGVSPLLQNLFDAFQSLSEAPASTATREVVLNSAQALVDRLHEVDDQLQTLRGNVNTGLRDTVTSINSLASSLASINKQIVIAQHGSSDEPNDLLDQRDYLMQQLSEKVGVQTVIADDGTASVFIGSGQALVTGFSTYQLEVRTSQYDPADVQIAYSGSGAEISNYLTGGQLGGYLAFRSQTLDRAQSDLGLLAQGLADSVNQVQTQGMDLEGQLGTAFFSSGSPTVLASTHNDGSAQVTATLTDVGALQRSDYELSYNGGTYTLRRLSDSSVVASGSSGPLSADGLSIDIDTSAGAAANGDRFLIQPTRNSARDIQLNLTGTEQIAAALPIHTGAATGNIGTGAISSGSVSDVSDPALRTPVEIRFTSETTFDVVDVSDPSSPLVLQSAVSYDPSSGATVLQNGWEVRLSGKPQNGDVFSVSNNAGGEGDNRNALALAGLATADTLVGHTSDLNSFYGAVLADIGAQTDRLGTALSAQTALLDNATAARDAVSGVNLDEEAANLLKYQQAYQASAQVMQIANEMFQTLLAIAQR